MTFSSELLNRQQQVNLVIRIGSVYYSNFQPDSGLTVDADKIGLLKNVKINGIKIDIKRVQTNINTLSFNLTDKDEIISLALGANEAAFADEDVDLYIGFITGSFDFSDYSNPSTTQIKNISLKLL